MKTRLPLSLAALLIGAALGLAACSTTPVTDSPGATSPTEQVRHTATTPMDKALEDRILALDPETVTGRDARETLAQGPVPRIMLLHGGVYGVHLLMESFAEFLSAMGYPIDRIRDAGDGGLGRPRRLGLAVGRADPAGAGSVAAGESGLRGQPVRVSSCPTVTTVTICQGVACGTACGSASRSRRAMSARWARRIRAR